jgi:hypothetical protein
MFVTADPPRQRAARIEKAFRIDPKLRAIADALTPKARKQFLAALRTLGDRVTIKQLTKAVRDGYLNFRPQMSEASRAALQDAIATVNVSLQQAAAVAARRLGTQLGVELSFDLVNPEAVREAEQFAAQMVRYIGAQTEQTIRTLIQTAITDGIAPRVAARQIKPLIGLLPQHGTAVLRRRQKLIASGVHPTMVDRLTAAYQEKLLKYRAEMIARQEIMRAQNEGQRTLWKQAQGRQLLPPGTMRKWIITDDDRICEACLRMEGAMAPIDGYFIGSGGLYRVPQDIHPQCRCTHVLVWPAGIRKPRAPR